MPCPYLFDAGFTQLYQFFVLGLVIEGQINQAR
jgi:hypothetical protein